MMLVKNSYHLHSTRYLPAPARQTGQGLHKPTCKTQLSFYSSTEHLMDPSKKSKTKA